MRAEDIQRPSSPMRSERLHYKTQYAIGRETEDGEERKGGEERRGEEKREQGQQEERRRRRQDRKKCCNLLTEGGEKSHRCRD